MTLTALIISLSLLFSIHPRISHYLSTCSRLSDSFLRWNGFIKVSSEVYPNKADGQLSVLILADRLDAFDIVCHLLLLEIFFPRVTSCSCFSRPLSFCHLSWLFSIWHLNVVSRDPVILFSLSLLLDNLISFHPIASNNFPVLVILKFLFYWI